MDRRLRAVPLLRCYFVVWNMVWSVVNCTLVRQEILENIAAAEWIGFFKHISTIFLTIKRIQICFECIKR